MTGGAAAAGDPVILYDAALMMGFDEEAGTKQWLGQLSLDELGELLVELDSWEQFAVFAASQPGGEWNMVLGAGDPNALATLGIGPDSSTAFLQQLTPGGYQTLATWDVFVEPVPEPSAVALLALAATTFAARRRRQTARCSGSARWLGNMAGE